MSMSNQPGGGIRRGRRSREDDEQLGRQASIDEQRNMLLASWIAMQSATAGGTHPIGGPAAEEINRRLQPGSTIADLNVAEQLLVSGLAGAVLDEAIARRLVESKARGVPNAAENGARYAALQTAGSLDDLAKRAFLRGLVTDWQHFGLRSAQVRYRRQRAIAFVSRLTVWAVSFAMLPFLVFLLFRIWPATWFGRWIAWVVTTFPNYGLYTAVSFGAVGALFSRYTRFQEATITAVPLDDAEAYYGRANVLLHLLIGTVGAMFLYFFVAADLVEGTLVPDIGKLTYVAATSDQARGPYCDLLADPVDCAIERSVPGNSCPEGAACGTDRPAAKPSGITTVLGLRTPNALVPSKDLALLIIWAILAGFSERLVPNLLAATARQIEARSEEAERRTVVLPPPPPPAAAPPRAAPPHQPAAGPSAHEADAPAAPAQDAPQSPAAPRPDPPEPAPGQR